MHIYYIIFYIKFLFKIKTYSPKDAVAENQISVVKLHLDYYSSELWGISYEIHAQISFTHGHLHIFFLCKSSELGCQMGYLYFLQKE